MAPTMPDSSYRSSSRENSVGSSLYDDIASIKSDEIPLIISRQATGDWHGAGGLGISSDVVMDQRPYLMTGHPRLAHTESEPASATGMSAPAFGLRTPRRRTSTEEIKAKRESIEKKRADGGGPDSGDDEDEELGDVQVRAKSPLGKATRQSSRLGHEMLRTNSRGSVVSNAEDPTVADVGVLRRSLEIIEHKMEGLQIPEEPNAPALAAAQPRKMHRTSSQQSSPEQMEVSDKRPASQGHITPPVIFPLKPGAATKDIIMDPDITPVPTRTINLDEEPTPRPQGSPSGRILSLSDRP
jgi:serine/threonine-protein kinase RIM15